MVNAPQVPRCRRSSRQPQHAAAAADQQPPAANPQRAAAARPRRPRSPRPPPRSTGLAGSQPFLARRRLAHRDDRRPRQGDEDQLHPRPAREGKVTIYTYGEVKPVELMPLLETILRVNGATIVKVGDFYRIIPINAISQLPAAAA